MAMDHVTLTVRSVDRSIEFYRRTGSVEKTLHGSLGITHLGVRVQDLNAAIERLKAAGATMIGEPFEIKREKVNIAYFDENADKTIHYVRKRKKKAWRIALFSDPDGVTVELVES